MNFVLNYVWKNILIYQHLKNPLCLGFANCILKQVEI